MWKARDDGRFYHFKTYPICNWSGDLGPKEATGDRQAPEGVYSISQTQMNPNSKLYLAFNLGYPNAYDRSWNRTGEALMVHGNCKSAGCYAMTDALAEEIYGLAREAFRGRQTSFDVHALPFRMTNEKLARFQQHKWFAFWRTPEGRVRLLRGQSRSAIGRRVRKRALCRECRATSLRPHRSRGPLPALPAPDARAVCAEAHGRHARVAEGHGAGTKTRNPAEVEAAANLAQQMQSAQTETGSTTMPPASALGFNQ